LRIAKVPPLRDPRKQRAGHFGRDDRFLVVGGLVAKTQGSKRGWVTAVAFHFEMVPRSLHCAARAKGARAASVGMTGF